MMELTKEEQIQAIYDLKVGYTLGHADIAMLKSMARQLLAGLEQEPVAQVYQPANIGICAPLGPSVMMLKPLSPGTKLYAAPQLPQPAVVSGEMIDTFEEEFRRAFEVSDGVEQLIEIGYQGEKFSLSIRDAATWWKLGRAAMLQGAESLQGWIPCSERMPPRIPDTSTEYLVYETLNNMVQHDYWNVPEGNKSCQAFWNNYHDSVTHWQPLPASPQQEVK